ncbi:hypothetical protein FHR24_002694 [Wenyingzhuangia heitensis]|uniref:GH16 domain-containing protein n=1 Tax=Wenyingzhuangia heitensis TaxID=1487859 RepID=A0ABX0UEB3_9FLAO|nr:beta-agarase [Wenyingzhuangia heitensis]NIJ46210.1 hypothetical protein [Wenyingzhuangia heitensis]
MNINKSLTVLFLFILTTSYAQPKAPKGKKWQTVAGLTDEFDEWDQTKWRKTLWNYEEPVQMVAENSGVSNGKLWIKATLDASSSRWFKTSRVMSKQAIKFPMYTESCMKTSGISAFSTFWMNKGSDGGSTRDEIDICEHNTNPSFNNQSNRPYTMYSQYFVVENNDVERAHGNFDNRKLSDENPAKGKKWNEAYQTLGCYWPDANHVYFYINGEPAGSVTSTRKFTRDLNIIWDLWTSVHSWTGGIADKKDLSNDKINMMYVDWIHTYQLVND